MAPVEAGRRVSSAGGQKLGSDGTASQSGPTLSFPLTFLLTPVEAHKLQRVLAKAGLVKPPQRELESVSTNPPTPSPSYPNTPVSGLPPKNSPFTPFSSVAAAEEATLEQDAKPTLGNALKNFVNDDALPLSSRTALRAFVVGWFLNYTLQTVIPTAMRRRSIRTATLSILSLSHKRIGAALALFAFTYRTLSYVLTFLRLKLLSSLPDLAPSSLPTASHRTRLLSRLVRLVRGTGIVPFIAALLASPALLILPSQTAVKPDAKTFPRKSFALDLFTKGLQAHFSVLRKRRSRVVSWVPDWCDSALLYAVGNGQLLWAFLFEPACFPKGYGDLILARSSAYVPPRPHNLPSSIEWPSRREVADHVALLSSPTAQSSAFPAFTSPSLSALHPSPYPTTSYPRINPILDFSPAHPAHTQLLCALLHPTEPSCKRNFLRFWATEWKASARFISIFLAAINVLKWKSWTKDPEGSLFRFAMGVVQGATVISGSIGSAWALTCAFQHYFPRTFLPRIRYFLNGFLSSVFIFAVPASRRSQLGLYVGRMSLDSTWQVLAKQRRVRSLWNGDVLLLAVGFAMLTSIREEAPAMLSGYLRNLLYITTGPRLSRTSSASAGLPLNVASTSPSGRWATSSSSQDIGFHLTSSSLKNRPNKSKTG